MKRSIEDLYFYVLMFIIGILVMLGVVHNSIEYTMPAVSCHVMPGLRVVDDEVSTLGSTYYYEMMKFETGIPVSYVDEAVKVYEALPQDFKSYLKDEDWNIMLVSDLDYEQLTSSSFKTSKKYIGLTSETDKVICIKLDDSHKTAYDFVQTFAHELGHAFDIFRGSQSDALNPIRANEIDTFTSNFDASEHNTEAGKEYFADAFSFYMISGNSLKEMCPETYSFINDLVEN